MDPSSQSCALCGKRVGGAEPAHAVNDKFICDACQRLVSAREPRPVLPYAGQGIRRRRPAWLWPAVAGAAVFLLLGGWLLVAARQAAVERARVEQMRAILAQQQARAAAVQARLAQAQTQPAE